MPTSCSQLNTSNFRVLRIGTTAQAVHINCVCPPLTEEKRDQTESTNWTPPLFHHGEGPMRSTLEGPLEVQDGSLRVGPATALSAERKTLYEVRKHRF